jgi:hypothetical protein
LPFGRRRRRREGCGSKVKSVVDIVEAGTRCSKNPSSRFTSTDGQKPRLTVCPLAPPNDVKRRGVKRVRFAGLGHDVMSLCRALTSPDSRKREIRTSAPSQCSLGFAGGALGGPRGEAAPKRKSASLLLLLTGTNQPHTALAVQTAGKNTFSSARSLSRQPRRQNP